MFPDGHGRLNTIFALIFLFSIHTCFASVLKWDFSSRFYTNIRIDTVGVGERSPLRENHRNGYRERDWQTRLGELTLKIPKLRQGSYLPDFLEPRRHWERAFVSVVSEAYVAGISTRKVEQLVEAMGAKGMSRSAVSTLVA